MVQLFAPLRRSAAALGAVGAVLAGCERSTPPPPPAEPVPAPAAAPAPAPAPVIAPAPPALGRAELLQAMKAAAAAYAAGRAAEGEGLVGRRFAIRQAFGCLGPAAPGAPQPVDGLARWSWSPDQRSIEITLLPADWRRSPLVAGGGADWEAVEGVWLARPWLETEGCPAAPADPAAGGPEAASPQTMGLAAVFAAGGSRLGRRKGRPYSFTVRGDGDTPPAAPAAGYRLVLEGRLADFAQGRAIRCSAAHPDQRPVCIAAVQLDRVAFEDAAGQVLSEWASG